MADLQSLVDTLSALDEENLANVISSVLQARPEVAPRVVNFCIPDLTYPPSKALLERRSQGTIKSFNANNGFGFIDCPELRAVFGNDVFIHNKQIGDHGPGAQVSFAVCLSKDNKPQAYDLQPMGGGKGGMGGMGCMGGMGGMMDGMMGGMGKGSPESMFMEMMSQMQQMKGGKGWGDSFKGKTGDGFGKDGGKGGKKGMSEKGKNSKQAAAEALAQMPENYKPFQELGTISGTVKSSNPKSGYGFITSGELQEMGFKNDAFLHQQQAGGCEVGDEVVFTCYLNAKGQPQAKDVRRADGGPAQKKLR